MRVALVRLLLVPLLALPFVAGSGALPWRESERDAIAPRTLSTTLAAQSRQVPQRSYRGRMPDIGHSFYFTRGIYGNRFGQSWAVDYPEADDFIVAALDRLTGIDVFPSNNAIEFDDPNLRRFPFLYIVEVGRMQLRESEVQGLRSYLLAGGFLAVDDFWGTAEWRNFEREIQRVLPEYEIVEIPLDHPIFSTYYQIEEIIQVPNVGQGVAGGPTHERDGYIPHVRGIFDDKGRLMVIINWNTDLGDAWEWADLAGYPLSYSTYAYQMGANFILYALTR